MSDEIPLAEVIPPEVAYSPAERAALRTMVAQRYRDAAERDASMRAALREMNRPAWPFPGVPLMNPRTK